ncbi:MAG: neutral/alkaline non-lysosomal ceramidase N-terminal domain-containing protein [Pirellulaceae bacterium]
MIVPQLVSRLTIIRLAGLLILAAPLACAFAAEPKPLQVGFGETDITPDVNGKKPVWLAGYGPGRKATGVHDPLMARCLVLGDGTEKIALVSVDLIGLQYPNVKEIRKGLANFKYVLVSSTHNHEGPDVVGIWGRGFFSRGVDDDYVASVVSKVVELVKKTSENLAPATAAYGTATDETLVGDSRKPIAKDGVLRVLKFTKPGGTEPSGLLVQWNSHPESMGSKNTLVTADFPYATVAKLKEHHKCPILYMSGAVGGLMAPPDGVIKDAAGKVLDEGDFEYCRLYGEAVADLATKAMAAAEPIELTPFTISAKPIAIPVTNTVYRLARVAKILRRQGRIWEGDFQILGEEVAEEVVDKPTAVETEVAYLRLGDVHVASIPGELYPELIYGKFQEPAEPNADYPDAPLEPTVESILPGKKWLLFGLANDEIGYIIPRRQWDSVAPYAYGRETSQYGEINSCSPDVAPIIMQAFKLRVQDVATPKALAPKP